MLYALRGLMGPLLIQKRNGKKGPRSGSGSRAISYATSTPPRQLIPSGSVANVICHCARLIGVVVLLGGLIAALTDINHQNMSIFDVN